MDGGAELVAALIDMRRWGATGTLTVDAGGARTWIGVEIGVPVSAEGGTRGDSLGSVLRDEGLIDEAQYGAIVRRVTEGLVDNEALRFGEVAVELGFVDAEQVRAALSAQLERKLLECMSHEQVRHHFTAHTEGVVELPANPCDIEALVLSALGTVFDPPRIQRYLGPHLLGYLRLEAPADVVAKRIHADADAERLLYAIDGSRQTAELMGASQLDPARTARLVAALLMLELATAPPEPSRAPMTRENTGLFEVPLPQAEPVGPSTPTLTGRSAAKTAKQTRPAPTPAQRREAQARRARLVAARLARLKERTDTDADRQESPARRSRPMETRDEDRRAAAKARAAAIAGRIAQTRGSVPVTLGPSSMPGGPPSAGDDREQAIALAIQGEHGRAAAMLEELEAASAGDERARLSFARRYCELSDVDEARGRDVLSRGLQKEAKRLLRMDKHWAFGHFALGQLRLADGDEEGAARSFRNAAALEPKNIDIQRLHRILSRRVKQ